MFYLYLPQKIEIKILSTHIMKLPASMIAKNIFVKCVPLLTFNLQLFSVLLLQEIDYSSLFSAKFNILDLQ